MLRYPHPPNQARAAERRLGVNPRRPRYVFGGYPRHLLGVLQIVLVRDLPPVIEAVRPRVHELRIRQPFIHDNLRHRVQQSHVRPRTRAQPQLGVVAHLDPARVDDDEFRAALHHRAPHPRRRHRMVRIGVRADYHQAARFFVVDIRIGSRAAPQRRQHRLHRRRVAEARAVVDMVAAHDEPRELLLNEPVFVRRLRRSERPEGVLPMLRQPLRDVIERLVPARRLQLAVAPNHRRRNPVGMVHESQPEPPLDAEHPQRRPVVRVVQDFDNPLVGVNLRLDPAAHAAIRACRLDRPDGVGRRGFDADSPRRAGRQTRAAGRADRIHKRHVHKRPDARLVASAENVNRADKLVSVLAGLRAAPAHDAGIHRNIEHGVGRIRRLPLAPLPLRRIDAVMPRRDGQLAIVMGFVPVFGKHPHSQLQHPAPDFDRFRVFDAHVHPIRRRRGAGRRKAANAVYPHQASPAGANGLHVRILAQLRNIRPRQVDGVQHGRPLIRLHPLAVDGKCDCHAEPFLKHEARKSLNRQMQYAPDEIAGVFQFRDYTL